MKGRPASSLNIQVRSATFNKYCHLDSLGWLKDCSPVLHTRLEGVPQGGNEQGINISAAKELDCGAARLHNNKAILTKRRLNR